MSPPECLPSSFVHPPYKAIGTLSGYFWVVLGIVVASITKYLTAVRLRGLAEKVQREHKDADDLRHVLVQHSERESLLKSDTGRLEAKLSALRNAVISL